MTDSAATCNCHFYGCAKYCAVHTQADFDAQDANRTVDTSGGPVNTSPLRHVPDGDGGYLCECPDSECCPEDRSNPLGPHVQVVKGWLDDSGCLLPDPDGIAYRRTFSDWEQVPDGE